MKTYAETSGFKPFNWAKFLKRDPETISERSWRKAYDEARKWPTCACGNLCDAIPRSPIRDKAGLIGGAPLDFMLYELGNSFFRAIRAQNITPARRIFAQIETRSAEILKEMGILK